MTTLPAGFLMGLVRVLLCLCTLLVASVGQVLTSEWSRLGPGAAPPSKRFNHRLVYDAGRAEIIMFGGKNGATTVHYNDTWAWNGQSWILRTPASGSPPVRANHSLAFDPIRNVVVMFGGGEDVAGVLRRFEQDTWTWNGAVWTQQFPSSSPPRRARSPMVFHGIRQRVVLFGGDSANGSLQDTWEWDGVNWVQQPIAAGSTPPRRILHGMAYDPNPGEAIMYGGRTAFSGGAPLADTWVYGGGGNPSWSLRQPASSPGLVSSATMAFDGRLQRVVLFGWNASSQETWSWDNVTINWHFVTTNHAPSSRSTPEMAFDPVAQQVVLFGGRRGLVNNNQAPEAYNDTWVLGAPLPAEAFVFGGGCPALSPLGLNSSAPPRFGSTISINASMFSSIELPFLIVGLSDQEWDGIPYRTLPFLLTEFGISCNLLVSPDAQQFSMSQAGAASWSFTVPGVPALNAATIYLQAAGLAPNGVRTSHGLGLRIGT